MVQSVRMRRMQLLLSSLLVSCAGVTIYALVTYDTCVPSLLHDASDAPFASSCDTCFAFYASLLFLLFGYLAWGIPVVLAYWSCLMWHGLARSMWKRRALGTVAAFLGLCGIVYVDSTPTHPVLLPAGHLGGWWFGALAAMCDAYAAYVFSYAFAVSGILLCLPRIYVTVFTRGAMWCAQAIKMPRWPEAVWCWIARRVNRVCSRRRSSYDVTDPLDALVSDMCHKEYDPVAEAAFEDPVWHNLDAWAGYARSTSTAQTAHDEGHELAVTHELDSSPSVSAAHTSDTCGTYQRPSLGLFRQERAAYDMQHQGVAMQQRAEALCSKLADFGIQGEVVRIAPGPVVTLFEYAPARDVKITRIMALESDLSLALQAQGLRIIAPIPGKPVVGFEVANAERSCVSFAGILASASQTTQRCTLPLVLGCDTGGDQEIIDLVAMPHVLVAGSTGSGKSVALHGIIVSLLFHTDPDDVRLVLIDPKRLEFSGYDDIRHLLFPVVSQMQRVPRVIKWLVAEMDRRYDELARTQMRSIQEYQNAYGKKAMPHIVMIIDELADAMMTCGKEIEEHIARLAQMARAAGIHCIVATQRPSVDVITGMVKVNFPARIAFKVTSKVDSRTILDAPGAEKLLGKGDMLFLTPSGDLKRLHGAYVEANDIDRVVGHVRSQGEPEYVTLDHNEGDAATAPQRDDPLYEDVAAFVQTRETVSISLIQRTFRIGYNRSALLIDALERHGVVLPPDGSKMRKVAE